MSSRFLSSQTSGRGSDRRDRWSGVDAAYYHSHTGGYADTVDAAAVSEFLSGCLGPALDLPCGSGRITGAMRRLLPTVSADYSPSMLSFAKADPAFRGVRADALGTPFADNAFGAVVCLRLLFHYQDCEGILRELGRITAPGQRLLVDTLNTYSLRWCLAKPYNLLRGQRSTPVVFRTPEQMECIFEAAGLEVVRREGRYLLPTRMYRLLPLWLCRLLEKAERLVPARFRGLTLWTLVRPPVTTAGQP